MDELDSSGLPIGAYWRNLPNAGGLAGLYGLGAPTIQNAQGLMVNPPNPAGPQAPTTGNVPAPPAAQPAANPASMLMQLLQSRGGGGGSGGGGAVGGGYDPFAGARQIGKSGTDLIKSIAMLI